MAALSPVLQRLSDFCAPDKTRTDLFSELPETADIFPLPDPVRFAGFPRQPFLLADSRTERLWYRLFLSPEEMPVPHYPVFSISNILYP